MKFLFWIESSRGTDVQEVVNVPEVNKNMKNDKIKNIVEYHLEDWCQKFGCAQASEQHYHYGYARLKDIPNFYKDKIRAIRNNHVKQIQNIMKNK